MILAVVGGKGGVGRSTVAYNLGAELGGVVVDADLGMADLPCGRGPDLHDVLARRAEPVEAVREGGPVALLPCGRTLAGARAADPTELVAVLETLEGEYGPVVVDCPAGLGSDVGIPLLVAGRCVLVTAPDELALGDALRARALARELDAGLCRVVLNRVEGNVSTARLARAFGAPVTVLPESSAVPRAMENGVPVSTLDPESLAVERFRALAGAVSSP